MLHSSSATPRGSAIAKLAAENAARHTDYFEKEVPMWVYEEQVRHHIFIYPLGLNLPLTACHCLYVILPKGQWSKLD
jgi:hypothetical protein